MPDRGTYSPDVYTLPMCARTECPCGGVPLQLDSRSWCLRGCPSQWRLPLERARCPVELPEGTNEVARRSRAELPGFTDPRALRCRKLPALRVFGASSWACC